MSLSLEQASSGSFALSAGGLVVATTTTKLKTANTINYVIDGVFKTAKTTTDNIAWAAPSTSFGIVTPITAGNKCAIALWLDGAGAFTQTQGPLTPYSVSTDVAAPPPNPGGRALVGIAVVTAATATFTPGTTAFAAAGTSVNYYDVMSLQATGLA